MIVLAVILYATLSSDPVGADDLPQIPYIDKWIHAIMMGGLVGAIAFDMQRRDKSRWILTSRVMWLIFAGVAVFGIFDELLQGIMDNGRGMELLDYAADCAGGVVAVFTAPPAIKKVLRM